MANLSAIIYANLIANKKANTIAYFITITGALL